MMKIFGVMAVATAATFTFICTQPPGSDHNGPPRDAIFVLFDTDEDGEISMKEVEAAAAILKKRDTDNSGTLTRHELPRPPHRGEDGPRHDTDRRRDDRPGPPPPRDGERGPPRDGASHRQRPAMDDATNAAPGSVLFRGGYETKPVDKGRPVALIAAALGVEEQVFRDAFSNVKPASFGPPSVLRAKANKKVLLDALGKHGITNERLDEVSNYYRYRPEANELWTVTPAQAKAVIKDGKVTGFDIINAGSGYSSAPKVKIAGHTNIHVEATIEFSQDMQANGRISKLTIVKN